MKHKTNLPASNLLREIANKSDGKIVIGSASPAKTNPEPKSNWGHHVSIMPCAETLESAKFAIDTLSLERTNIFGVCIHHTDGETVENARKVLKSKNFSTHLIIDKNGDITVELPLDKRGAACVGFNRWMWQVDVVGRLHINEPTDEQIKSLTTLLKLLSCGREIVTIDKKFAQKCRKLSSTEVQKETISKYQKQYEKLQKAAVKNKSWKGVLDNLPFTIIYHGEVRPTACCGKYLINKLPDIIKELQNGN